MSLLSLANIQYSIGDRRLLDGVNLTLDEGRHVALVGRNGCGKSTLLKLIAGWSGFKPDVGQVQVAQGASVGYLAQDPDLDPDRSLREEAASAFAHLRELHQEIEDVSHEMATAEGDRLEQLLKRYEQIETKIQVAGGYAG